MFARSSLLALCLAASALTVDLNVKVTGPTVVTSVDNFVIKTVITNNGAEAVNLLNDPNSILTPQWNTNTFGIVGPKGTPAKFDGVTLKWSPASAIKSGHVATIAPGKSIELTRDLSGVYSLTESGTGVCTINASTNFSVVAGDGLIKKVSASAQPHIAHFSGQHASFNPVSHYPTAARNKMMNKHDFGYSGCTPEQKSQILSAALTAQTYIDKTIDYLETHANTTTRFTTWFGSYTETNHSTVLSNYLNSQGDLSSIYHDCSIAALENSWAYMNCDDGRTIYLGHLFWGARTTGADSQPGAIVRALTNFIDNGGTQEYAHGILNATDLTSSYPDKAIMNADSYQYFAENDQSLS